MTWEMVSLLLGLGLTFGALRAFEGLDSRRGCARDGQSPVAGAGSAARVPPRRRHVVRHFAKWSEKVAELLLSGGSIRLR